MREYRASDTLSVIREVAAMFHQPNMPAPDYAALAQVKVNADAHAALAAEYAALPSDHAADHAAWDALARETAAQWGILAGGHGFTVTLVDADAYEGTIPEQYEAMADDVLVNRHIYVLSTAATGGHPYWPDAINNLFRAVHDIMGHVATERSFDRHGEEAAYQAHARTFSSLARRALATETRGQNAALIATGEFQEQKVASLPPYWMLLDSLAA